MEATDNLSAIFSALADPTRRAMLDRLAREDASAAELAKPFDIGMRAVYKHLSILERAGLIERGRDAQARPSRVAIKPLQEIDRWLDEYRMLWEARFDRMEGLLEKGDFDDE